MTHTERDRRARLASQFDQMGAEGRAFADDPNLLAAMTDWMVSTEVAARTLLATGLPSATLVGAMLGPMVDIIIKVRDGSN